MGSRARTLLTEGSIFDKIKKDKTKSRLLKNGFMGLWM